MAELKPCPFCGGEAEVKENKWYEMVDGKWEWVVKSYYVKCRSNCSRCMIICETISTSREEAIEAWNRRVNDG